MQNILFGKISHHFDSEIKQMLVRGCIETRIPNSSLVHDSLVTEMSIQYNCSVKQKNLNING